MMSVSSLVGLPIVLQEIVLLQIVLSSIVLSCIVLSVNRVVGLLCSRMRPEAALALGVWSRLRIRGRFWKNRPYFGARFDGAVRAYP